MKAVLRLVFEYFFGTAWLRWLSATGFALIVFSAVWLSFLEQSFVIEALAFFGVAALFLGSSMMPLVFGCLARNHSLYFLPHGRLKLLASALITTGIVTVPLPLVSSLALMAQLQPMVVQQAGGERGVWLGLLSSSFFWQMNVVVFLVCSWLYVVLWYVTSSRSAAGLTRALLLLAAILIVAPKYARIGSDVSPLAPLSLACLSWGAFAAYFFLLPRWKHTSQGHSRSKSHAWFNGSLSQSSGNEIDLLLGTTSPWALAFTYALPMLFATQFAQAPGPWLFFLTITSTISAAVAGGAAGRSRSIWLRTEWSRLELFTQVEARLWRYNSCALGMLLLMLIGGRIYLDFESAVLLWGAPLIVLGTAMSTYLGLMMTRGLRWLETGLAVSTMLLLMATAILGAAAGKGRTVLALQLLLVALTLIFRRVAQYRWNRLDWMQCRTDTAAVVRA